MKSETLHRARHQRLLVIKKAIKTNKYTVRELKKMFHCSQRTIEQANDAVDNFGDK